MFQVWRTFSTCRVETHFDTGFGVHTSVNAARRSAHATGYGVTIRYSPATGQQNSGDEVVSLYRAL